MNLDNKLTIFFTFNGILIGSVLIVSSIFFLDYFSDHQIPIDPTVDHLFPTVALRYDIPLEANFGNNPAKSFEYDIKKCPGMEVEWI
jgi:hypothetical protein